MSKKISFCDQNINEINLFKSEQSLSKLDLIWSSSLVTEISRAKQKKQSPKCIWFTGLSGSGKSTLANALELQLFNDGFHTMLLDGDNLRHGLCRDLDMSEQDRVENIRRVAEVAKLMTDAGLIVICAFISPYEKARKDARLLFKHGDFIEVYLNAPLNICELRDPKGLYKKARSGEISNFTGVDSIYEVPENPDLILDTASKSPKELVSEIIEVIK